MKFIGVRRFDIDSSATKFPYILLRASSSFSTTKNRPETPLPPAFSAARHLDQ